MPFLIKCHACSQYKAVTEIDLHKPYRCPLHPLIEPPLQEGDFVRKRSGYRFEGHVVSSFTKRNGERRIVVENADELLHIFNERQMELVSRTL